MGSKGENSITSSLLGLLHVSLHLYEKNQVGTGRRRRRPTVDFISRISLKKSRGEILFEGRP
jgi:hypothetical protein